MGQGGSAAGARPRGRRRPLRTEHRSCVSATRSNGKPPQRVVVSSAPSGGVSAHPSGGTVAKQWVAAVSVSLASLIQDHQAGGSEGFALGARHRPPPVRAGIWQEFV